MSYDIELCDQDGRPVEVPRHEEGGTYVIGGKVEADLNVTYNYAQRYAEVGFSIRSLDGRSGADTAADLRFVVDAFGTERVRDYWEPTHGNAGYAASILLAWAELHPDATWRVT